MWYKDENGHSYYMETVSDCCVIKIEDWEHGYYVAVANPDELDNTIPLRYFYTFQDARAFFTNLSRLIKQQ